MVVGVMFCFVVVLLIDLGVGVCFRLGCLGFSGVVCGF